MILKLLSKVFMLCLLHSLVCATRQTLEDSRNTCNRTDLVIVLDSSYSVTRAQFEQAKSFLIKMVKNLTISQDDVRVAVVRYENNVDIILSLNNSSDTSTVEEAIARMEHRAKPGTHTGKALKEVREKVLERDIKGEQAKRVVMTITDGESTDFDETEYQATQLRDEGVRLVWLFVFENSKFIFEQMDYEKSEMEKNGDPTVTVRRFDDLGDDLVSKMLEISCQDLTADTPTTAFPETSTVPATLFPETSSSPTETVPVTSARTTTKVPETGGPDALSAPTSASVTVFPETFPSTTKTTSETARAATTAPRISVKPAATASETSFAFKTNFPESSTISTITIPETSTETTTLLSEISSGPTTIVPETSSHPAAVISITMDTASTHDASTSTAGPKGRMTENSSTITPPLTNKTNADVTSSVILNSSQTSFVTGTVTHGKDVEALTGSVASFVTEDVTHVTDTEISTGKQESIVSEAFTHVKDADTESQQSGVTEAFTQVKDVDISTVTETFTLVAGKESSTEKRTSSFNETSLLIEDSENATEALPLRMTDAFTRATEHLPTLRSKAGITEVTDSAWSMDVDRGNHKESEQPSPETGSTSMAFTTKSPWIKRNQEHVHGETVTTSSHDSETEKGQEWPIYAGVGSGSAAVAMVTAARIGYGLWRHKKLLMSNDIEMQKIT